MEIYFWFWIGVSFMAGAIFDIILTGLIGWLIDRLRK